MEITEVRIFPRESEDRKLKAYATITIDNAFVVRNVKVIEGNKGLFVAMPSRKLREACPKCNYKNAVRSRFCNQCGAALPQGGEPSASPRGERKLETTSDENGRQSGHRDIAHPITQECREYIQNKVLSAYKNEIKSPTPPESYEGARVRKDFPKAAPATPAAPAAPIAPAAPAAPAAPVAPAAPKYESQKMTPPREDDFEGDLEL
ncbi:MAG: septation protein SpoVG family protein [Candidatus Omnitrophica bacterium]|nr:septation protein SpoVG family protein [Candidatus Omnitrophota bacterium]MBU4487744.1 septation protein SpoVG family protein [Candidatus Omnitrophota bacterium]MCG2705284.1 septation protein SpoVG family protein [Candidatus Omnitrophota bacterium]